jgi:hypothetical protein
MAKSWDEGRKEGRWDRQHLSNEEEKRIQSGIDDTMKSVIDDQLKGRAYDPWRGGGTEKVTPVGAPVVKDLPSGPTASEPSKPLHPTQDWLRLGSTVAEANLQSAEAALAKLEEEEPGKSEP